MWTILDLAVFAAGFAASWCSKDRIIRLFMGTDAFIRHLEAKALLLKAAL